MEWWVAADDSPGYDKLTRALTLMETVSQKMDNLERAFNSLRDEKVSAMAEKLAVETDRAQRLDERVELLERRLVACAAAVGIELLGLIGAVIYQAIMARGGP